MPVVLHVTGYDDEGRPTARLLHDVHEEDRKTSMLEGRVAFGPETFSILREIGRFHHGDRHIVRRPYLDAPSRLLPRLSPDDVVACDGSVGWPMEASAAEAIRLVGDPVVLGTTSSAEQAIDLAISWLGVPAFESYDLQNPDRVRYEAAAERSTREPEEGLVMAWRERYRIESHLLLKKGALLFHAEDSTCEDLGIPKPREPGLWLLSECHAWSHVDYETQIVDDYGLEGELSRISPMDAAARFGKSGGALRAALQAVIDDRGDELGDIQEFLQVMGYPPPAELALSP